MEIEVARRNMLTQQIRACDVLDEKLLDVFRNTAREKFVPEAYLDIAFADERIPLAHDQFMMTPFEEGKLLQALNIHDKDTVLEIGTGSGYLTALLAQLSKYVFSIDIYPDFCEAAQKRLAEMDLHNFAIHNGDACTGWDKHAPYDVICVTGSLPELPDNIKHQLGRGGRLFAMVGKAPTMRANLYTLDHDGQWHEQWLFDTNTKPLLNAVERETFTF